MDPCQKHNSSHDILSYRAGEVGPGRATHTTSKLSTSFMTLPSKQTTPQVIGCEQLRQKTLPSARENNKRAKFSKKKKNSTTNLHCIHSLDNQGGEPAILKSKPLPKHTSKCISNLSVPYQLYRSLYSVLLSSQ